jgi:hypothetical protein
MKRYFYLIERGNCSTRKDKVPYGLVQGEQDRRHRERQFSHRVSKLCQIENKWKKGNRIRVFGGHRKSRI